MELDSKSKTKVAWLYGLVVTVANMIGSGLPSTFSPDAVNNEVFVDGWRQFMCNHQVSVNITSILTFVIPVLACIIYARAKDPEKSKSHFINLPFAFAIRGVLGWIFYFFAEIGFLLIAKQEYDIQILSILFSSIFYMVLEGLFSFTLAYFVLETIHRAYVLPKFFPEGKLTQYKGIKNFSVKGLFLIFYLSGGLFPVLYVLFAYLTEAKNNGKPADVKFLFLLAVIMVFVILITISFTHFFANPLAKMKKATEKIKEGAYGHKVHIVSNDSFGELADTFNEMSDSLKVQAEKVMAMQNSIIKGMATMVESRDNSTGGHIMRTSSCVLIFSDVLKNHPVYGKYSEKFYDDVIKAAPMHDLGKIAVDDAVLRKPGKFTDEEYEKMKRHSAEGARIVGSVLAETDDEEFKKIAVNVAHYHHEKWNGSGYPEKISGEDIPLEARIMALADVFDALVSKRCYKDAMNYDVAFGIIEDSLGSHFDPNLGAEFLKCRPQLEDLYNVFNQAE